MSDCETVLNAEEWNRLMGYIASQVSFTDEQLQFFKEVRECSKDLKN